MHTEIHLSDCTVTALHETGRDVVINITDNKRQTYLTVSPETLAIFFAMITFERAKSPIITYEAVKLIAEEAHTKTLNIS